MPYHVAKAEQGGSLSPMGLSLISRSAQQWKHCLIIVDSNTHVLGGA